MASQPLAEAKSRLSNLIRQHPLANFFALTYAISWILWIPLVVSEDVPPSGPTGLGLVLAGLGSLVPSAVAILLIAVLDGKAGVRKLLRRLLMWRVGVGWYLAVVLLSTLALGAVGLSILLGGDTPDLDVTISAVVITFLLFIFPGSAGGEEIGWRGFALPHLQADDRSALGASVVLGVVWGVWHLPLFLIGADIRPIGVFPAWVLLTVAASVIYTWMYNGTGGSLLIVVLYHAASNLPLTIFLEPLEDQIAQPFLIYVALTILAAAVVVAATGPEHLSRTHTKQVATPYPA
jgi:CAAX protease family protein